MHPPDSSFFATLTYADEHLPVSRSVCKAVLTCFIERVRYRFELPVRFFGCGEYGSETFRPHYHAILFGLDGLDDLVEARPGRGGGMMFHSEKLASCWEFGEVVVSRFTVGCADYVARYCVKKATGDRREAAYSRTNLATGEIWSVEPEFVNMSRMPGIGSTWFDAFAGDAFPSDFVVVDGERRPVPAYYLAKLGELEQLGIKFERKLSAKKHAANNTERRLYDRHQSAEHRLSGLRQRGL